MMLKIYTGKPGDASNQGEEDAKDQGAEKSETSDSAATPINPLMTASSLFTSAIGNLGFAATTTSSGEGEQQQEASKNGANALVCVRLV